MKIRTCILMSVSTLALLPAAIKAETNAMLDGNGTVHVTASGGTATYARVAFPLPVGGDWKVMVKRGTGLKARQEWAAVGNGATVPWYVLLNDGSRTLGYGVMVQPKAMCAWRARPGGLDLLLDLRAGGQPLALGRRTLEACTVVKYESRGGESAFALGRRLCRAMCPSPRLPKSPIYGFNDWYAAYGCNTATNFLADAAFVVSLADGLANRPYVVMDDGWQRYSPPEVQKLTGHFNSGFGPWEESSPAFGMDMRTFCEKIAALGAKPGLWYRPLCMKGKMCDPSDLAVRERIKADIRRFRDWGFKYVKIDYLTYDFCEHFKGMDEDGRLIRDERAWSARDKTTAEVLTDLYRDIREAAGDDMVILGCNAISHFSAGIFETMRAGADTSGKDWEQTKRNGIGSVAFKGIENGTLYAADPDCVGLAEAGAIPWQLNAKWLDLASRSGMPLFISWRRTLATQEIREAFRSAFRRASRPQETAEPLDWLENDLPRRWHFADGEATLEVE